MTDVDECLSGSHHCSVDQRCVNNAGSFSCSDRDASLPITAASASPTHACPSGTVWNGDMLQCEDTSVPLVDPNDPVNSDNDDDPDVGMCPDGGVWNSKTQLCDMPLVVKLSPSRGGNSHSDDCPVGTLFNSQTGQCDVFVDSSANLPPAQQPDVQTVHSRCPMGYAWNRLWKRCEGRSTTWWSSAVRSSNV